ncbi:helix-turn-helix domain-containing protein [Synechococcales cyanobacterium C]|uniref:Helix-turn-helix domain-containing protein n=1 Tax=Petrachloros mirabilis ULC683 TaxID=2781853 RepID=A0A8K2A1S7_9CYAN|nr:AraC family transcriptional regulator [Petrachloros mirabilis]NCJ07922.1 helix-turn-helix domain-containing protein [Petrachloros mirabilis ULC683]
MTITSVTNHTQPHLSPLQPPILMSEIYGWQNILVREFEQPPSRETYQSATEHLLCLSLNGRPSRVLQQMNNRQHSALFARGDLSITPAGALLVSQWHHNEKYLQIRLASKFLEDVAQSTLDNRATSVDLAPEFRIRTPEIEQIAMMLLSELRNGAPTGLLYAESLTHVLAVHLLKHHSVSQPCIVLQEVGLSDRQLLQVTDYIVAHLASNLQLSDLAASVGLSQFHFSRLFKQSIGVTPYQYILRQRIERAKQLLKTTKLSVMEIALLCGFSSHSHLGKLFRQHTGVTPKRYRMG